MLRLENLYDAINFQRIINGEYLNHYPSEETEKIDPTATRYVRREVPGTGEVIFEPIKPNTLQIPSPSHHTPGV